MKQLECAQTLLCNSVTSDCAVGGAEVQKLRHLATRNVYNFLGGGGFADTPAKRLTNRNRVGYWVGGLKAKV